MLPLPYLLVSQTALAVVIDVPGDYSTLATAVAAASAGDTIVLAAGTFTESGIVVAKDLTIAGQGANATFIQAHTVEDAASNRVFEVSGNATVILTGMTIRHGKVSANGVAAGGGILVSAGTLTIADARISNNRLVATGTMPGAALGGGIYVQSGALTIRDSTISANRAEGEGYASGGGLVQGMHANILVERCAIIDNTATSLSGGITRGGGISDSDSFGDTGSVVVRNSTLSGNVSLSQGGALSGGAARVWVEFSTIVGNTSDVGGGILSLSNNDDTGPRLRGTILFGNIAASAGPDIAYRVQSSGNNFVGTTSGGTWDDAGTGSDGIINTGTGDLFGVDPLLGSLANNGGPTPTLAIDSGSPARDASTCTLISGASIDVDQRGRARDTTCDVGAFEFRPPAPPVQLSAEPPGGNCPLGGVKIEVGLDTDGDGTLSATEVSATEYVCNEESGKNSLLNVSDEPAGVVCSDGGKVIHTGLDADGDGALDPTEITQTTYVCNGSTGPAGPSGAAGAPGSNGRASLIAISSEPAGDNCGSGGQRIDAGLDENGNSALDAAEVSETSFVCVPTSTSEGCSANGDSPTAAVLIILLALWALRGRSKKRFVQSSPA